ncbi:hypothetical protein GGQ82_004434 [Sphingobium olei]|nr:hypothetical protein SLG_19260 [Sphingobium sp. SYK-6]
MSPPDQSNGFSPLRQKLSSFDNAYKIALILRRDKGVPHYVVRGILPLQAYRVTTRPPAWPDRWLAMVA